MKNFTLFLVFFFVSSSTFAQDLIPLPNNWVGKVFTDESITFETDRDPLPDTVFAKTAPDVINFPVAPDSTIFDSIWYHLGDSMPMKNHVKAGDDVFDYEQEKDAMSYFKFMYNDTALFLMLKYIDHKHQFTNHGWEICWQTKDPLRYEPDYLSAADDTLRKKSYARYTALGGGKARVIAGGISRVDASNGEGSFTYNPLADSILTDTDRTKIYWFDNGKGVIRAVVPIHFDALAYLTDPATGEISNPDDYTPFDPNVKKVINWDIKTIGDVNGTASHYWWDSPNDYAYAINYYGGRLKFTFEPVIGTDTTLADITISDESLAGFDSSNPHYSLELPVGTVETPNVQGIPTDDYAAVEIIPAANVKGDSAQRTTILNVTAHNDTITGQYAITFNVIDNDDATLNELLLDGTLVAGFDNTSLHYQVELSPGTIEVPVVTATPTDSFASHEITPATNLSGDSAARTTLVGVTAEDGSTYIQYTITFTVLPYTDASLENINVDGFPLAGFDPDIYHYHVDLAPGTMAVPEVVYTLSNDSAVAFKEDATDLSGDSIQRTAIIEVTAEDGIHTSKYSITFDVLPYDNAYLSGINIDGASLAGFDSLVYHYSVELPPETVNMPAITFELSNDSANAEMILATDLSGDSVSRLTVINVIAEDGITALQYTILFVLLPNDDAALSDLRVNGNTIPGFDPGILHYHVVLTGECCVIPLVEYTTRDSEAGTEVIEATNLTGDSLARTTIVKVTAEDQVTVQEYTVTFSVTTGINMVENPVNIYMSRGVLVIEGVDKPEVEVFNMAGKKIKSAVGQTRVSMHDASRGIYLVRVKASPLVFKVYKK